MNIQELIARIGSIDNADRLPSFINVTDISDEQVKMHEGWQNYPYAWGIIYKSNEYVYFETDSDRGYISVVKSFSTEEMACDYAFEKMTIISKAFLSNSPLDIAVRYIMQKYNYSEDRARKMANQISIYPDIFEEFLNYIRIGKFRKKDRTQVEIGGYTAEVLFNTYDLSPLGAYNYLVYLQEDPTNAIADLKAGLPRK